jgi:hypothetical protein
MFKTVDAEDDYNGFVTGCNSSSVSAQLPTANYDAAALSLHPALLLRRPSGLSHVLRWGPTTAEPRSDSRPSRLQSKVQSNSSSAEPCKVSSWVGGYSMM